jgi:hypothetical protein
MTRARPGILLFDMTTIYGRHSELTQGRYERQRHWSREWPRSFPCLYDTISLMMVCDAHDRPSVDSQTKSTVINISTDDETRLNDDWFAEGGQGERYG